MSTVTRFNLLLLEEGELFFEDYAAILYLPKKQETTNKKQETSSSSSSSSISISSRKQLSGRLKVASKNLIFEAYSISYPIIRFPYSSMKSLKMDKSKQHLIVITSQIVKLKAHNVVSPYIFENVYDESFIFEPSFSSLNDFVGLVAKIYQMTKNKQYDNILSLMNLRENKIQFDSSWFVDINEIQKLSQSLIVSKLTPLIETRGQIQITSKRIYFQPFYNQSSNPMLKYNLSLIKYIYKRRHIMLPNALEIIFKDNKNTLLLSFENEFIRNNVYKLLLSQPTINIKESLSLKYVQKEWLIGNVSNYDYLLFLNQQSGRSFNDLTQYPIFPWIITDYNSESINLNNINIYRDLSKPIGALNPNRLNKILKRYREMPSETENDKFMYGSHYSTPGYVMYFLVRQYPEYMLRFQNGKFDAPDRLFSSIERTWDSAYNSLTDVKELIPQFYNGDGSFLLNTNNLNFGIRSDKKEVHHVELPKWSQNNPKIFIDTLRKALESKYVSNNLHLWIDLIWGYKQNGIEAEKAYNKFYYLTYQGAVDINKIKDKSQLKSIQMQINEFGQASISFYIYYFYIL